MLGNAVDTVDADDTHSAIRQLLVLASVPLQANNGKVSVVLNLRQFRVHV